jgi:hypothetical protein
MATATGTKTMELEGALGTFQLPDVLRFLAMGHMTGALTLGSDLRTVELSIKEGRLVGTASPDRHLKVGQILVYSGQVGRKDLEEILEAQRADHGDRMIGEWLVERKLATLDQVRHALGLQMEEEIWDLLSWSEGSFKFEHGASEAMGRALVTLDLEPQGMADLIQRRQFALDEQFADHALAAIGALAFQDLFKVLAADLPAVNQDLAEFEMAVGRGRADDPALLDG